MSCKRKSSKVLNPQSYEEKRESYINILGELYLKYFLAKENASQRESINKKMSMLSEKIIEIQEIEKNRVRKQKELQALEQQRKEEKKRKKRERRREGNLLDEGTLFIKRVVHVRNDTNGLTNILREAIDQLLYENNNCNILTILDKIHNFEGIENNVRCYIMMLLGGYEINDKGNSYEYRPEKSIIRESLPGCWEIKKITANKRKAIVEFYEKYKHLNFDQLFDFFIRCDLNIKYDIDDKIIDEEKGYGPQGIPQDPNYHDYKIRIKRK